MYWTEFLTIAVAHLFAVASPGPDFAVVTRQSVTGGTKAGLWTSFGVAVGILLHVGYCILGVALIVSQSPTLFNAMKYIAALYLFYLGAQSVRQSTRLQEESMKVSMEVSVDPGKAFFTRFSNQWFESEGNFIFPCAFYCDYRCKYTDSNTGCLRDIPCFSDICLVCYVVQASRKKLD